MLFHNNNVEFYCSSVLRFSVIMILPILHNVELYGSSSFHVIVVMPIWTSQC